MKTILSFLIIICLLGCTPQKSENMNFEDTNFGKIDDSNLKLKFGNIVRFHFENQEIETIVIDILEQENEYWFGICFISNSQLFGRTIPHGFNGDCVDLIDVVYVNEKNIDHFKITGKEGLDFKKIGVGSYKYLHNFQEIKESYINGIERRKLEPTPCTTLLQTDLVYERYFDIKKFK